MSRSLMRAFQLGVVGVTLLSATTAGALVDPTQPPDYHAPAAGGSAIERPRGPVLQSTFVAPDRKRAVIDGKTVGIGDKVNDARVVDIRPYEVVLRQGGRETSLRLMPQILKHKSGSP